MKHVGKRSWGLACTLTVLAIVCILPFYFMFIMSTYETQDIYRKVIMYPGTHAIDNLKKIFSNGFGRYYINSFYIALVTMVVSVMISAMAGFGLAKYRFKMRKLMYYFILMTMMVPVHLGLVAYIVEMRFLGLSNTHVPLVLPFLANAFSVFWMTQYIKMGVPTEVLESARIDGCTEMGVFLKIVIPFLKPALVTIAVIIFMWSWNNYLLPLIILNRPEMYTIPVGISTLGSQYRVDYAARIAGLAMGTIPMIVLFAAGAKYFVSGFAAGAVKG